MKISSLSPSTGFSLAEVVLATGLCSVALLSIIGVLGVSLSAERDSARDTALAAMSSQIVARLNRLPFDEIAKTATSEESVADGDSDLPARPDGSTYYFDSQGTLLADSTDVEAVYACVVTARKCEETKSSTNGTANLLRLELAYTWPATEAPQPNDSHGHQRLHASLARY